MPDMSTPPSSMTVYPSVSVAAAVAALAQSLTTDDKLTNLRFGVVTAVESDGLRRLQLDIAGTAWLSRDVEVSFKVGDRVWAVQQGSVIFVGGRTSGGGEATPIGTVVSYAGSTAPTGWLLCDGSAVSRTTYAGLFAFIGTAYGTGDGSTTFNVPNLQNKVPVGSGSSYSRGATGGQASVTLSTSQIPQHSHSYSGNTGGDGGHSHSVGNQSTRSDISASAGSTVAATGGGSTGSEGDHSHSFSGTTGNTGSGNSHENMPPFVAMPYIIKSS